MQRYRKCSAYQLLNCALFLYGNNHTTLQIELRQIKQTIHVEMFWKFLEMFANNLQKAKQTQIAKTTIQLYAC